MKLVNPKTEYWKQEDLIPHIAKCARVCYKSSPKDEDSDAKLYKALISSNHKSMLRHGSRYFIVSKERTKNQIFYADVMRSLNHFIVGENPYINIEEVIDPNTSFFVWYVSTNEHFMQDHKELNEILSDYEVSEEEIKKKYPNIVRCTFAITTTRIINDEYTRRSPNNIAGESTRYCNYSKSKFNREIKIGYSASYNEKKLRELEETKDVFQMASDFLTPGIRDNWSAESALWFSNLVSQWAYNHQTQTLGRTPDDSRNCLPIGINSTFVFTYTVKKWKEIIDARLYNSTGKAHIDAKEIAEQIEDKLIELDLI